MLPLLGLARDEVARAQRLALSGQEWKHSQGGLSRAAVDREGLCDTGNEIEQEMPAWAQGVGTL